MLKSTVQYSFLFLVFSFSLLAQSNQSYSKGSEFCADKKVNSPNLLAPENVNANIKHTFDVLNYKLDLDIYNCFISPYPKSFKASNTITLKVDSTLNSITLNATSTSLVIDSVRLAGVSFTHSNNILTINLDRVYNVDEVLDVKIYYRHNNVSDNAFYVSSGFVFTDCEPEGARKWFPCWDKPSDKATIDLTAKVPATVKLGSNGRLADSVKTADTIYYNWKSNDPVATYLTVISAKVNYNLDITYWHKLSNPNDSIPFRFYWNAGESTSNLNYIKSIMSPMTTAYSQLFGEHPFEKNGFATLNSQFAWGGMENQTLTSLCPDCWSESLVAHEFAHQWFGDMITCATWADIFLNEGFATFTEALWLEHNSGYAAYKNDIDGNANTYLNSNPGWPISDPSWAITTPSTNTLFNYAITYMKGSCVLHLLRYVMGDTNFFTGLYSYANDPNLKYKSAVISDFKDKMSAAYGEDLTWFFDEWIYQANHPVYANNYWISNQGGGVWQAGFVGKQTQTTSTFRKMPIEIKVTFTTGSDTLLKVMNDANNQIFWWNFNRQVSGVYFDPNNNIVLKQATLTQIAPLPVELTSFSAKAIDNFIVLDWTTATELNNAGFEVERKSSVNENWIKLAMIDGSGTSSALHNYSYTDYITEFGVYTYRLKQIDFDGSFNYSSEVNVQAGLQPDKFELSQNYPNPFNPTTVIKYTVPGLSNKEGISTNIAIKIYDVIGNEIATLVNDVKPAGVYEVTFNAQGLPSGVYFYKLQAGSFTDVKKMILLQ